MNTPITINNDPYPHPGMEFEGLLKEAIELLHDTSGNVWTDFNQHDPGLTLLEQLCYVITDLSSRINYDIEDHLASMSGIGRKALYSPAEILPSRPVTLQDFRKLVLDVPGVRNAWIEAATFPVTKVYYNDQMKRIDLIDSEASEQIKLKGLYRTYVDLADADAFHVLDDVKAVLMQQRNLCEDFLEVQALPTQLVTINVDVEVGRVEDLQTLTNTIFDRIDNFISPEIRFYSLQEMRAKGLRIDQIFDGPLLAQGFIDDQELGGFQRKSELRSSDLIQVLMDIEGINAVRQITMQSGDSPPERWLLQLEERQSPRLDRRQSRLDLNSIQPDKSVSYLRIFRDNLEAGTFYPSPTPPTPERRIEYKEWQRNLVQEVRPDRHPETYYSLQHHLPATYALAADVLPKSASPLRRAQVRQLRAYLMIFEQIMANYFSQTSEVGNLLSYESDDIRTLFYQPLSDSCPEARDLLTPRVPAIRLLPMDAHGRTYAQAMPPFPAIGENVEVFLGNDLLGLYEVEDVDAEGFYFTHSEDLRNFQGEVSWRRTDAAHAEWLGQLTQDSDEARVHKNQLLNHLLARFSEDLSEYTLLLNRLETNSESPLARAIEDKLRYLREYVTISRERAGAFNYAENGGEEDNIPGYLLRVARKLGIREYQQRSLAVDVMAWFEETWIVGPKVIDQLAGQLADAGNYLFDSDTGQFYIELPGIDQSEWPRTVATWTAENKANAVSELMSGWEAAGENDEGFHLIEHILLRPRKIDAELQYHIIPFRRVIQEIQASSQSGHFVCTDPLHGLFEGETITIRSTGSTPDRAIQQEVEVQNVTQDTFEVQVPSMPAEDEPYYWIRTQQTRDPYSLQMTINIPSWPRRFRDPAFRLLVEKTLRTEAPAHLKVFLQWMGPARLAEFEDCYATWLDTISQIEE